MGKRNELRAIAASILITALLVGGGAWWFTRKLAGEANINSLMTAGSYRQQSGRQKDRAESLTQGADGTSGVSMMPGAVSEQKQKGLDALAAGDFAAAKVALSASLAEKRNDPEALIYLNNAKIGNNPAHTIAVSVPASRFSNPALEMLRGVAQAQSEINEDLGIGGMPLKVMVFDDEGSPEQAVAIATDLVADPTVLGVVGHYGSDTTLAAAEIYEKGGLTAISPTSTAMQIADAGEYIFRTVPSDRLAAATLARYTSEQLKKKKAVVFFNSESTYSRSVKSEFTTEFLSGGGEVIEVFDTAEPGFSAGAALRSSKAKGADVLMLGLTLGTVDIPIQILAVNKKELPIVASDSLYSPRLLDVGQENALGMTIAVPWHALNYGQSDFVKRSRRLWGGDVNWRTVTAYDAVMALAAGLDTDPTREGVASALSANGFQAAGATGEVSFFSTGDRNQPSQLVQVAKGDRTGSGYEFVPAKQGATAAGSP